MSTQPLEARCDHCKQTRPLFLYEPDHDFHIVPRPCEWCARDKQPLLCTRCWGAEREREENDPLWPGEADGAAFLIQAAANNRRILARQKADNEALEGIAEATRRAEAGS